MNFRNCTYAGVLLALLLGCSGSALAASETSVSNGVQIGEPVSAVGIDVDLRDVPVAAAWRPGMPIKEAHKRQFFPPDRINTAAPSWLLTEPDRLPELQKLWDDNRSPFTSQYRSETRVS
ncbi:MAG: hypothetical protein KDI72_14285, partial [Xanthomonadales bacterium]|nr:hypothetical protein [Xanthomonadales bacterium]